MKTAATIILLLAGLVLAETVTPGISVGNTIRPDFLGVDRPEQVVPVTDGEVEEAGEDWIDTARRRRTRRQSRFC